MRTRRLSVYILLSLCLSLNVWADVEKVNLKVAFSNLSEGQQKFASLSQLKDFESTAKWTDCTRKASRAFELHKEVRGWVALVWLHCLNQEQKKKSDFIKLEKSLVKIATHKDLFLNGPWSEELSSRWVDLQMSMLESQVQNKKGRVVASLEELLESPFSLEKEQKARVYQALGDVAFLKKNYLQAQFFYDQAQSQSESKAVQDKLDFISKSLGDRYNGGKLNGEAKTEILTGDAQHEDRMRQALRQNDSLLALKEVMSVLNNYSGSRGAKRLKDKPIEIYNSLNSESLKYKALSEMGEADGSRLIDWAQALHRRADYQGSLILAQKAVEKERLSLQKPIALLVSGRSAHFLGRYDQALGFFNELSQNHFGSDEAAEALLRAGLIYYREKKFTLAIETFDKLTQYPVSSLRDRYDLQARYWLVRSLEATQSEKAKSVATDLVRKFPFSYYGLRLSAEAKGGVLSWPEVKDKKTELRTDIFLVGDQKKSWHRFMILSKAGWIQEARKELALFPVVKNPSLKVHLAIKLAELQQYPLAIRWLNEAIEKDPRLQREEFIKVIYPLAFANLYKVESERYGIHVDLLRSLTRQESAFNPQAVSSSNAMGLMQMIPATAQEVAKKLGLKIEMPDDMFRADVNIPMGSLYVSQMLGQFQGHVPLALAAYNAGPTRLKIWIEARPDVRQSLSASGGDPESEIWIDELPWTETSFYVKAILRNVLIYRLASDGSFTLKPAFWQDLRDKKSN